MHHSRPYLSCRAKCWTLFATAALCALLASPGCKGNPQPPQAATEVAVIPPEPPPGSPRIISTVPAATLNLVLMNAASTLVGVTRWDVPSLPAAYRNLPVVGDYETMNYERLITLHPTAVIVQTEESRISPKLRDLAQSQHFQLVNIHLDTLDDLWQTVHLLGQVTNREIEADAKIADAKATLESLSLALKDAHQPRVLYVLSRSPLVVIGGKTFLDQLITLAGGSNAGAEVGTFFPTINPETLLHLAPDVLLISAPDQEESTGAGDERVTWWKKYNIPATKNDRVLLMTDGHALMASIDLPDQARALAKMLHPDLAAKLDAPPPTTTHSASTRP